MDTFLFEMSMKWMSTFKNFRNVYWHGKTHSALGFGLRCPWEFSLAGIDCQYREKDALWGWTLSYWKTSQHKRQGLLVCTNSTFNCGVYWCPNVLCLWCFILALFFFWNTLNQTLCSKFEQKFSHLTNLQLRAPTCQIFPQKFLSKIWVNSCISE